MKRILLYVLVLVALMFAPVKGANIGRLHPVEVVALYSENDQIIIETDTEDKGIGSTLAAALNDLHKTTDGYVYLDTAEYLLVGDGAQWAVEELRPTLRKRIKICISDEGVDLKFAAKFLSVHSTLPQLKDWKMGDNLPKLTRIDSRLKIS